MNPGCRFSAGMMAQLSVAMSLTNSLTNDVLAGPNPGSLRTVWTQPGVSAAPRRLAIFLDAELYIERVQAPLVLNSLQDQAAIQPVAAVYVSNDSAASRHVDYTCHAGYAEFIAHDVVNWALQRFPTTDPEQLVLIGLSLSGLAAADIAVRFPARFQYVICQSPSFWWEQERFRKQLLPKPSLGPSFWICVGTQETTAGVAHAPTGMRQESSQLAACTRTCDTLRKQSYTVVDVTYHGGHDPACWQADLYRALSWACAP